MIWTIFRKDLIDAIRDARVLVALIVPLGIGVFYNLSFDDEAPRPSAEVVYVADGETALPEAIDRAGGAAIDLTFTRVDDDDELRTTLAAEDADLGLVLPAGFDEAIRSGASPTLTVVTSADRTLGGDYVIAALEPALRDMAGQTLPAQIEVSAQPEDPDQQSVFDRLGLRTWSVTVSAVMMIGMIAMLAVPVILAEETEKKTLDALVLITSYLDVVVAKALVGLVYVGVMMATLMALTGLTPDDVPLFAATVLLLSVTLLGFGLLLGGLFRNANQLNTWSGVLLLPVIAPAFMAALPLPNTLETIVGLVPTGEAAKLLINGVTGDTIFPDIGKAFLVIIVWGIAAYSLLLFQLSRRQA
jgi:ABC-2 type transport system permease protein